MEKNLEFDYKKVYIHLPKDANRLLSESCSRSSNKKTQEATLCLEDHLNQFRTASEIDQVVPHQQKALEAQNDRLKNS
jgi:uncharacterized membrane-anchored protein YhcB (DUF1043 family)